MGLGRLTLMSIHPPIQTLIAVSMKCQSTNLETTKCASFIITEALANNELVQQTEPIIRLRDSLFYIL